MASRLTKQIPVYASWLPDPESSFIDAFTINCNNMSIYASPPYSIIWRMLQKIHEECNSNSSALDNTIMVYKDHGTRNLTTYNHSHSNQSETSTLSETSDVGLFNPEPVSSTTSISSDAQAIISAAWRNTTKTKYNSTFKRWTNFCSKRNINSLQPNTVNITEFLTEEFKRGLSYNSLVSARSALGHCLSCDIIHHSTVSAFLKRVYNLRPPTPEHFAIWNVITLLSHIQHQDISTFYGITKKLAALFMILVGTRINTLVHLKVTNMYITDTEVTFTFDEFLKTLDVIIKKSH